MSNPKHPDTENNDLPRYIDVAFEQLISALADGNTLSNEQYGQLSKYFPKDLDTDLDVATLGVRVGQLVSKNCLADDFANTLTDAFIEAMETSPEHLTMEQLKSIAELLPADAVDEAVGQIDYERSVLYIKEYINYRYVMDPEEYPAGEAVEELARELLMQLDAGFTIESLEKLCMHYDGHETIGPAVVSGRTVGTIVDGEDGVRFNIPTGAPKRLNDLSDEVMDLVEKLGTLVYTVDSRAWDYLLIYVPQHRKLKKRMKKVEKAIGMRDLRKQIKSIVS